MYKWFWRWRFARELWRNVPFARLSMSEAMQHAAEYQNAHSDWRKQNPIQCAQKYAGKQ